MTEFTLLREGTEVAEISVEGKEVKVVPKNLIKNLSLLPSVSNLRGVLKALNESGYRVSIEKGPFKFTVK